MLKTLANAWKTPDLKKKMIFTMIIILLYRIGSNIPVPYVNALAVEQSFSAYAGTIFDYLTMLSGSGFAQANLFALSVSPYITAQIVIQLLTIAIPALEKLSKEGEEGRRKINQITRVVTIALSIVTAYGYYNLLSHTDGILLSDGKKPFAMIVMIACYCAGSSLVMWLAEKIDEHGIGNGVSMILFVNILSGGAQMATQILALIQRGGFTNIFFSVLSIVIMLAVTVLVVFITNSERRIPVQYAKRVVGRKMYGGQSSHIPIKVNMSGVLPVIFASSILSLPSTVQMFVDVKADSFWGKFFNVFTTEHWAYTLIYFVLIIFFAYFYSSIQYNPIEMANNLAKNSGTIPGVRSGRPTSDYIAKVISKIVLLGALLLSVVALFPIIYSQLTTVLCKALDLERGVSISLGGTSIIILVGVAIETVRQLESQMMMRHYKGFLD